MQQGVKMPKTPALRLSPRFSLNWASLGILSTALACGSSSPKGAVMSVAIPPLSADMIRFFRNPDDSIVVVRWQGIAWRPVTADGLGEERGDGKCEVEDVLRSPALK